MQHEPYGTTQLRRRPAAACLAGDAGPAPAGYPGSLLCVAALNLVLKPHPPDDVRAGLTGRHLRVRVSDAGVAFDFTWRGDGFAALRGAGVADLEIGACTRDFIALAKREQDPDTLFFSRRLSMEGDTGTGPAGEEYAGCDRSTGDGTGPPGVGAPVQRIAWPARRTLKLANSGAISASMSSCG